MYRRLDSIFVCPVRVTCEDLFTSMGLHSHFKHLKYMTSYEHALAKQVNESKWTKRPLTHISANEFDESQSQLL